MKKLILLVIMFVFVFVSTLPVLAVDVKTAQQQKAAIDSRISKINQDKAKVLQQKKLLETKKSSVASVQAAEKNEYKQLVTQIDQLTAYIKEIAQSVVVAQKNYETQLALFKTRLIVMYENSNSSVIGTLVESKNIMDFYEKTQYMSIISENDQKMVESLNQAKLDLEYKKKLQEDTKHDLLNLASLKEERLATLKASRAELESQISRSKAALAKLEKEEDELYAESKALNGIINGLSTNNSK